MTQAAEALDWQDGVVVIAEVAQAHDGSLGLAHAHIDAAADAGADAVKFQTHIAEAESRPDEPWRVSFSYEDDTRFEYWQRMEFDEGQWAGLRRHAHERGLAFLSSPFSIEAFELLERVGVDAWKVASGETSNPVLVERCAASGLPVLLSTGMSSWDEIDTAVALVRRRSDGPLAVLQCTSQYPTPPEDIGLNVIEQIAERFGCAAGLSDHSGSIFPSIAAVALGARVVEVHIALSRDMFGPDVVASVPPAELAELVRGTRLLDAALAAPVDKDSMAQRLEPTRAMFTKSVVARRDLEAGTVLTASDLAVKKPGGGMEPARLGEAVGRMLRSALAVNQALHDRDLEPLEPSGTVD